MPRHNATGRSTGGSGHFVQLHQWMMNTAAWRSLSPQCRAVYIEVARLYNGRNNGYLGLGARDAADRANINKDTACKCFATLVDVGFLEAAQLGRFNMNSRRVTEWRLTTHKCDRTQQLPSKAFARWKPADSKQRPKRGAGKSETEGQVSPKRRDSDPQPMPFQSLAFGLSKGDWPVRKSLGLGHIYNLAMGRVGLSARDGPARVARPQWRRSERAGPRTASTSAPIQLNRRPCT